MRECIWCTVIQGRVCTDGVAKEVPWCCQGLSTTVWKVLGVAINRTCCCGSHRPTAYRLPVRVQRISSTGITTWGRLLYGALSTYTQTCIRMRTDGDTTGWLTFSTVVCADVAWAMLYNRMDTVKRKTVLTRQVNGKRLMNVPTNIGRALLSRVALLRMTNGAFVDNFFLIQLVMR